MRSSVLRLPSSRARRAVLLAGSLLLIATALGGAGATYLRLRSAGRERALANWLVRLEAAAETRKRAVQTWLAERRADAQVLAWDPDLIGLCVEGTCPKGRDPGIFLAHLENQRIFRGFRGAYLFTPEGELLLMAESAAEPPRSVAPAVRRVAREKRYLLDDLHLTQDGEPVLGFLAPVFDRGAPADSAEALEVRGVVGLYLEAGTTLFPVVAGGAVLDPSAEAYLVRGWERGAEIVSPVGGVGETRGWVHVSAELDETVEAAAVEGSQTAGEFLDYRGRRVLAAVRWISEAGWGLVVKVDENAALALWRKQARWETTLATALLLCLTLGVVAAWRTWAGRRYRLLLEGLRDREERLRALAYGSDDVIFIKDPAGRYQLVNPAAAELLGTTPEATLGKRARDFLPPHVANRIDASERRVLETGRPHHGEEKLPWRSEERTYLTVRIPIRDSHGNVCGVAGVLRDITGRKRDEEALAQWAQTQGVLYRLARSLTLAESPDGVLAAVVDGAAEAFGAQGTGLFLRPGPGQAFAAADARGELGPVGEQLQGGGQVRDAAERALRSEDVEFLEEWRRPVMGTPPEAGVPGSLALVPLLADGQPVGVIALAFERQRTFWRSDREVLLALGHMAGVALERARVRERLESEAGNRRRAELRLRRLHDSTAGLTGGALFAQVVRALSKELGARYCMLNRVDGDLAVPLAAVVDGNLRELQSFALEDTPCGEVVSSATSVHYPQGIADRFAEGSLAWSLGVDAYVGMPLVDTRGNIIGVLCGLNDGPLHLGDAERDLLELYARRVAGEVERQRAEDELAAAMRTLETLIQNLPGAVYRCSATPERTLEYLSQGAASVTGCRAEDLVGEAAGGIGRLILPDDRPRVWREIQAAVRAGRSYEVEYRVQDAAGAVKWVFDVGRAVDAATETCLEGVLFDHTERRSLEAQLTHSQRMEALGRLAGGVAHDFNNLLTAISGYAEMLLLRLGEDPRLSRPASEIVRAAERAADLTRQLLVFSRRQVVEPKLVDLGESVREVADMLERLLGEDVDFALDIAAPTCLVRADPAQLEQVLMNLVVNGRDAMPGGGRLQVQVYLQEVGASESGRLEGLAAGRYGVIEVTDSGYGIAPEVLEHIFEPFFTTKERDGGTGLGLATVYGIAKQAGGHVSVASLPGVGTTFRVYWPARDGALLECGDTEAPQAAQGRGEAVALVEDEVAVREVTAEHLRERGYRVLAFESGPAALAGLAAEPRVDVLVTDVVMPGLGGGELARKVRERWPDLPVVFVSGHTGRAADDLDLGAPATAFLQKPFRLSELEHTVRHFLDHAAAAS